MWEMRYREGGEGRGGRREGGERREGEERGGERSRGRVSTDKI